MGLILGADVNLGNYLILSWRLGWDVIANRVMALLIRPDIKINGPRLRWELDSDRFPVSFPKG